MRAVFLVASLLGLLASSGAAAQLRRAGQPAEAETPALSHVLVLKKSDGVATEAMLGVLSEAGVGREQASPILQRLEAEGEVIVAQGAQEPLEKLGKAFEDIGVQTTIQSIAELQAQAVAKFSEFKDSDVQELSLEMLSEWLQEDEEVMIAFYGHVCGHCKAMVPALKQAATELKAAGVKVGAFNLQANPGAQEIAQALQIRGMPTIRFIKSGNHLEYGGDRSASSLVAFAAKAKEMAPSNSPQEVANAARDASAAAEAEAESAASPAPSKPEEKAEEQATAADLTAAAAAKPAEMKPAEEATAESKASESKVEATPAAPVEKAAAPQGSTEAITESADDAPAGSKIAQSKLASSKTATAA
eukprot:scaffold48229_cov27-Tisochrysis_lutea.AAC.1